MTTLRPTFALLLALVAGCAAELPPSPPPLTGALPARDTTPPPPPAREAPPSSATARPFRFPRVAWTELPGGLKLGTLAGKGGPLVHVRVVIGAGRAADGERPGLAAMTAQLLAGGAAAARLASLGAGLSVDTGIDATTLGLAVTRDHLGEALDALGALVARPQWAPAELDRLKKRESRRLAALARDDGAWGASVMLYRDLFSLPSEHHPYATWSATPEDIDKLTAADCRAFHRGFYVPRNTFVVVSGDAPPDAVGPLVQKAFAALSGGDATALSFTDPTALEARKITLVDRPHSPESEVLVGVLGPPRADRSFAAFTVASQILGGAGGRIEADLRDKRGIVLSARSQVTEVAHGPTVLVTRASAPAARTGAVLQALLDHTAALAGRAPDADEVEAVQRALAGAFAVRLDAPGAFAAEVTRLRILGLPDERPDGDRKELGDVTPPLVLKAAGDHLRAGHESIVVAGDAAVIGPVLAHFGEVKVVDPTRGFARVRTLPMDAGAPLEVPRRAARGEDTPR